MAKVAELLVELRAGTAQLRTDLAKGEGEYRRGAAAQARQVESAQRKITEILERGEPLKAMRRKVREEFDALKESHRQGLSNVQQFEAAKSKIIEDYARRRRAMRPAAAVDAPAPRAANHDVEQFFVQSARQQTDIYKQLTWAGERMEGVRSTMFALGVATNSAADSASLFTSQMVKGAGKATIFGFAIGAVAAGIAHVVQKMEEAQRNDAMVRFLGLDEGMLGRLSKEFDELGRTSVVALAAAGKEARFTEEEIVELGRVAREEAEMSGKSFDESLTAAIQRMGVTASKVRQDMNAFLAQRFGAQAGDKAPFDDEAFNKNLQAITNAEARLEALLKRQDDIRNFRANASVTEILGLPAQIEEARERLQVLNGISDEMLAAKRETEEILGGELADPKKTPKQGHVGSVFGASIAEARARAQADEELLEQAGADAAKRARELVRTVNRELEDLAAEGDPIGKLNLKLRRELDEIAAAMKEARDLLADPESAEAAQEALDALAKKDQAVRDQYLLDRAQLEVKRTEAFMKASGAQLKETLADAELASRAEEQGLIAGLRAGEAFVTGFKRLVDGKGGVGDWLGFLFATAGQVASLIPGGQVAGAGLGFLGNVVGAFADGGFVDGVGSDRSDSNLVRVSKGEFIVNAAATRRARPLLEAINNGQLAGGVLPGYADGGIVGRSSASSSPAIAPQMNVYVKALDAVDAVAGIRRSFAPAFPAQREARQSALMFEALAPSPPRSR